MEMGGKRGIGGWKKLDKFEEEGWSLSEREARFAELSQGGVKWYYEGALERKHGISLSPRGYSLRRERYVDTVDTVVDIIVDCLLA